MSATTSGGAIWRTLEVEAGHGVVLCDTCLSVFEVSRNTDAIVTHITFTWRIFSEGRGAGTRGTGNVRGECLQELVTSRKWQRPTRVPSDQAIRPAISSQYICDSVYSTNNQPTNINIAMWQLRHGDKWKMSNTQFESAHYISTVHYNWKTAHLRRTHMIMSYVSTMFSWKHSTLTDWLLTTTSMHN